MDIFELTRKLIDIPSTTGDESEVGQYLEQYLKSLGYRVEAQKVENGRANIIAQTEAPPRIFLSTHMDTVPPHIPSAEDEGHIFGRGACDAKGIMAAQIFAAERLRSEGMAQIGLLFTVDEEMGSAGAKVANNYAGCSESCYLINGEPTRNQLATGSKGSLRLALIAKGRAGHSAYPEQGESAIETLLDVLQDIRACHWPSNAFFGDTTVNIGVIQGGTRPNVIAEEARADLQIRIVTKVSDVKALVENIVAGRARINYLSAHEPARLTAVEGFDQTVVRFTTDIPYLGNWGAPLLLGPGSILDAHTSHERVSKHELTAAVDIYVRLVRVLQRRLD